MATFYGNTNNENFNDGTTGNDLFLTSLGADNVRASAGDDTYNLGYVQSKYYWTNGFNDYDTVDYRFVGESYGLGNSGVKIVVDLKLGTIQKLNLTGTVLHTDKVIGVDAIFGTVAADRFYGRDFWDFEEFEGSGGGDYIDGRGGSDGVTYRTSQSAGVNIKLAAGTVKWLDGSGTDTLREIEVVTGTNFADTFNATGYGAASTNKNSFGYTWNIYNPLAGDDRVIGNGDTILGLTGVGGSITVDLSALVNPTTSALIVTKFTDDPDSLSGFAPGNILASGIAQVRAGMYEDTLLGGGKVNTNGFSAPISGDKSFEAFRGWGGNDFINGKTGFDRADYNHGNLTQGIDVKLAAGKVTGDPRYIATDTLRGIEGISSTYLDDVYDARGFTLSNAATPSVNSGDGKVVLAVTGETLASYASNEFRAYAGHDTVMGNDATLINFSSVFVENLKGTRPSVDVEFTSANAGFGSYGNTDRGFGTVEFTGVRGIRGGIADDRIVGATGYQGLAGDYGDDRLFGGNGNDALYGFHNDDGGRTNPTTLYTDNDYLDGGAGNDVLHGQFGNDTLLGGTGDDLLAGGADKDTLSGGSGNDFFVFNSKVGSDKITDFNSAADTFRFSQAGIRVGDGDTAVDGFAVRNVTGGFSAATEVVVFTPNAASLSSAGAAAVIGSASSSFAAGATRLFVVDNGTDSGIFLFTSSASNALVLASELTLIATFNGTTTAASDYLFVA